MVFTVLKAGNHFDRVKCPSDQLGHLLLLTLSQEQNQRGLLPRMKSQEG